MEQREDAWVGIYWRPAAAVVYLTICLFDFVVVPVWLGFHGNKLADVIPLVQTLAPEAQMAVMQQAMQWWQPLTLAGGGLFHLAFGAILGAAAWSRGQERIEAMRTSTDPNGITSG